MCGISGTYVASDEDASRELLLNMAGDLVHRGPDGVGLYLDGRFGMANTRLAVIDIAGGDQPLSDEHGRYWAMQNGEIYNYVELGAELAARGHVFRTSSDTEVLVHAYAEWGVDCLHRLNGDFAVAIWDRDRRELFLARDRFGVRPLFLSEAGGDLSFASEAKALLRHPKARRGVDPLGLVDAFSLLSSLPDRSALEGIRELPPGHYLVRGPDGVRAERRWWDIDFSPAETSRTQDDVADELRELLRDATRIRLRADVPVAAYLSGGIDSSLVVALARDVSGSDVASFGVGFSDARFDEGADQELAARELGTSLTRIVVGARDIGAALPAVIEHADRPTLRSAPAPLMLLSAAVRDADRKVVLTGEGADEIFAGYDIFREDKIRRLVARRPTDDPLQSHRRRFAGLAGGLGLFDAEVLREAARRGDSVERLSRSLPDAFPTWSPLGRAQYLEIRTVLEGHLMHTHGDRMLMANSVEGRYPYLDHRVAELAAKLPDRMRLRGLHEKHILRRAGAPLLPEAIAARRKRPFRAPIVTALMGKDAPGYVGELLSASRIDESAIFSAEAVGDLVARCEAASATSSGVGRADQLALMGVVTTMLLHERFVTDPRPARVAVPNRVVIGSEVGAEAVTSRVSR